jgi:hypothetical protein
VDCDLNLSAAPPFRHTARVSSVNVNREFLQALVDALRAREVSWAEIVLGVSRQAAWERFS